MATLDNIIFLSIVLGDEVLLGEPEGSFNGEQFDTSNEVVLLAGGTGKYQCL